MNRLDKYLQVIPLPWLLAMAIVVGVIVVVTPGRWRLPLSIVFMVVCTTLGQLDGLGAARAAGKMLTPISYILILFAALIDRQPKRTLPGVLLIYPAMGLLGFVFLIGVTASERPVGFVLRFNFLVMVLAAITVARTVVDYASFSRIIRSIGAGCVLALMLPLAALLSDPSAMFGGRRFRPFGTNPEFIGSLYLLAAPLCLYMYLQRRNMLEKIICVAAGAAAMGMALLSATRGVLYPLVPPLMALLWTQVKRPIVLVITFAIGMGVIVTVLHLTKEDVNFERLESLQTARYHIWGDYVDVISERPLFGLMTAKNKSFFMDESAEKQTHNVYLDMLYYGGLLYALPIFFLMARTAYAAGIIWLKYRRAMLDPLIVYMIVGFVPAFLMQGLANNNLLYPTYAWAFFFVLISCLLITWEKDLRGLPLVAGYPPHGAVSPAVS